MSAVPKLRFPEFDGGYKKIPLKSIAKIYDGTHQTPKYVDSGIPFFSVEQVTSGNFEKTRFIAEEVYEKECRRVKIEQGDILMTRIGDIGSIKYIDWAPKASFYVSLALLKISKDCSSNYLSHYMRTAFFQAETWRRTIHVAFPKKINLGEIGECNVAFPSLPEQQKIASFLSSVDKKIDLLRQKKDALELYKKGLIQKIFAQEIRFKTDDGSGFPDWEEVALGDVLSIKTGKKDVNEGNPKGKYPFFTCAKSHTFSDSYSFNCDAILVAGNGEVGHSQKFSGKFEAYQRTYVLSGFKLDFDYTFVVVNNLFKDFVNRQTQTGAMPYIKLATLRDFMIPFPSTKEQAKISNFISAIDSKIQKTSAQIEQMETFKKGLLQQMFI